MKDMLPLCQTDDNLMLVVRDSLEVSRRTCNPSLLPTPTAPPGHNRNGGMDGVPELPRIHDLPHSAPSGMQVSSYRPQETGKSALHPAGASHHVNFSRRVVGKTLETPTRRQFPCFATTQQQAKCRFGLHRTYTIRDAAMMASEAATFLPFEQHFFLSLLVFLEYAALRSSFHGFSPRYGAGCKAATDGAWKVWLAACAGRFGRLQLGQLKAARRESLSFAAVGCGSRSGARGNLPGGRVAVLTRS
jgi:hypothetical protein